MVIIKRTTQLSDYLDRHKASKKKIGFVPTMGALHKGHLALVERAKKDSDIVVCSIFVNPTQFNNPSDYQKYPSTLENDIYQLEAAGVDILFLPSIEEMYPNGTKDLEHYDLGYLETILEGQFRPGHFQGVCQVMSRLMKMVLPDALFMGQKDYQQCMVIKRLLEIILLKTEFVTCPTVREADGLAMSSRNLRLNNEERQGAVAIYKTLLALKADLKKGSLASIKKQGVTMLESGGFKVDYVEMADQNTLEIIDDWDGSKPLIVLVAAFLGDVRLIDNMIMRDNNL
jgi:pantoate--beta-alanine ligase